jgi:4-hydroxy-3-polyprenylbenzoate decarboxylase
MAVAVSADVDLDDPVSSLWGFLTRFEPARDVLFARAALDGVRPVYQGPLGIDATFKEGYPAPLEMDPEVAGRIDRRWGVLFPKGVAAAPRST